MQYNHYALPINPIFKRCLSANSGTAFVSRSPSISFRNLTTGHFLVYLNKDGGLFHAFKISPSLSTKLLL